MASPLTSDLDPSAVRTEPALRGLAGGCLSAPGCACGPGSSCSLRRWGGGVPAPLASIHPCSPDCTPCTAHVLLVELPTVSSLCFRDQAQQRSRHTPALSARRRRPGEAVPVVRPPACGQDAPPRRLQEQHLLPRSAGKGDQRQPLGRKPPGWRAGSSPGPAPLCMLPVCSTVPSGLPRVAPGCQGLQLQHPPSLAAQRPGHPAPCLPSLSWWRRLPAV